MEIYNEEKFKRFMEENPFKFSEERIERAKKDFYEPRKGVMCDELVEFVLWANGYPARHEKFGDHLLPIIKRNEWKNVLEVGCGEVFLLSEYLFEKLEGKVKFTAMDKCGFARDSKDITLIDDEFTENYDISGYDLIIAQEPCEAAECIIKNCTENDKPFCVILCGAPHKRLTGEIDEDVNSWYIYLMKTYPQCGFGIWRNGRFHSGYIYSTEEFGL
ncbi:MAG: hypothetical protein IJ583_13795 [Firmicutes bacterium]|nr:hypothetical protein [Bacillota bacterium]